MTTRAKTATASVQPPADAVAKDAHWAAKRDKLLNRQRPIATMTICDDHDVKEARDRALFAQARAKERLQLDPDNEHLARVVVAADGEVSSTQAAFDEVATVLRFEALESKTYKQLKAAHPPTEEQAAESFAFNLETLGPVLIAASSLDGITVEDATVFLDTWGEAESERLLNTVFGVQREERMDLGKG